MKQVRCSVSRMELDEALKFSGLTIVGEGENMKIARVPEGVKEIPVPEIDLGDVHIPRNHPEDGVLGVGKSVARPRKAPTPEQQLIEAEAKLSQLENKVYGLEGDIAWLVDAIRRIGEQLKSRTLHSFAVGQPKNS
jgi:hypothetical protein